MIRRCSQHRFAVAFFIYTDNGRGRTYLAAEIKPPPGENHQQLSIVGITRNMLFMTTLGLLRTQRVDKLHWVGSSSTATIE